MVYICLLGAGKFSTPIQPYASIRLEGDYGASSCIVPGRKISNCPTDKQTGRHKCWESECLDETRFCAADWETDWTQTAKTSFWGRHLNATEMQPNWKKVEYAHTCCHYPPALSLLANQRSGVGDWDARRARIDLWDEDWLNSNDYIGGTWVSIEHDRAGEQQWYSVQEHDEVNLRAAGARPPLPPDPIAAFLWVRTTHSPGATSALASTSHGSAPRASPCRANGTRSRSAGSRRASPPRPQTRPGRCVGLQDILLL